MEKRVFIDSENEPETPERDRERGGAGEKETGNGDIKIAHYSAHSLRYQHVTQFYRITFPARVYPLNVEQCL